MVSIADYVFLGRELPCLRSWISLLGLVVGAVFYVLTDTSFHVQGCVQLARFLSVLSFTVARIHDWIQRGHSCRVRFNKQVKILNILILPLVFNASRLTWLGEWYLIF